MQPTLASTGFASASASRSTAKKGAAQPSIAAPEYEVQNFCERHYEMGFEEEEREGEQKKE